MQPSPLKLDLTSSKCLSLELHFGINLTEQARRELSALGAREQENDERVFFHEDYRQDDQKMHSWGEVRIEESGESEVAIEYLVESELDDPTELHHTDFSLSHLFRVLESSTVELEADFTLRFELGPLSAARFIRLFPYQTGINGGLSVEYRGAHIQIRTPENMLFDIWYDLRSDETMEATIRFKLIHLLDSALPAAGLTFAGQALDRVLGQ